MAENEFDRILQQALMAAMEEDLQALPEDTEPMSPRQRERMEALLADPAGHCPGENAGGKSRGFPKRKLMRMAAAAAAVVVLLAGSALAYSISGGTFFRDMFLRQAEERGAYSGYMDADQLLNMGGGNVGAVVETEDLRLELVDAVSGGNTAMVAIRVTARQMTEFPQDPEGPWRNYGFSEVSDSLSQGNDAFSANWQYVFPEDDPLLKSNQCFLVMTATSRKEISADPYTVKLTDFGYEQGGETTVLCPGQWELPVELSGGSGNSRTILLNAPLSIGEETYTLTDAVMTPLSLTLNFTCESDAEDCAKRLFQQFRDCVLHLIDGTALDSGCFTCACTSASADGQWDMTVGLSFDVPLPAEAIQSLTLGEQTLLLNEAP